MTYTPCQVSAVSPLRAPLQLGVASEYGWYSSQSVCPWNVRFAQELKEPAFAARGALAGRDARTLARELLGVTQEEFSVAFKRSAIERAKLRGLKRNAAVVLGNVGMSEDVDGLTRALDDEEPLVQEHAAWALERIRTCHGA